MCSGDIPFYRVWGQQVGSTHGWLAAKSSHDTWHRAMQTLGKDAHTFNKFGFTPGHPMSRFAIPKCPCFTAINNGVAPSPCVTHITCQRSYTASFSGVHTPMRTDDDLVPRNVHHTHLDQPRLLKGPTLHQAAGLCMQASGVCLRRWSGETEGKGSKALQAVKPPTKRKHDPHQETTTNLGIDGIC